MFKKISLLILFLQLFFTNVVFTQSHPDSSGSSEEDAIKSVIMNETKSWADGNYEGMAETWAHEEYVLKMFPGPESYEEIIGWDSVGADYKVTVNEHNMTLNADLKWTDWNIRIFNDCAWASYIQTSICDCSVKKTYESRETRFLEKKNSLWKIVYLASANITAYKDYQEYQAKIENNINEVGYKLLGENKIEDAIDIFKKNVKLYPKSSNVYDSLGEAYMKNGDKELAIENYQRSLELDPKNNNAKEMLKKLAEN